RRDPRVLRLGRFDDRARSRIRPFDEPCAIVAADPDAIGMKARQGAVRESRRQLAREVVEPVAHSRPPVARGGHVAQRTTVDRFICVPAVGSVAAASEPPRPRGTVEVAPERAERWRTRRQQMNPGAAPEAIVIPYYEPRRVHVRL